MTNQCIFCQLDKNRIIAESELTLTIMDEFPVSIGHTLILPKRHVSDFFEITPDEHDEMFAALDEARHLLKAEFKPDGFNIGINNGAAAGQSIMHVHMHLIPRYIGDMEDPKGGVRGVIPEKQKY